MIKNIKLCLPMLIALWAAVFLTGTVYGTESENSHDDEQKKEVMKEQTNDDTGGEDELDGLSAEEKKPEDGKEEQKKERQADETQEEALPLRNPFHYSRKKDSPAVKDERQEERTYPEDDALRHMKKARVPRGIRVVGLLIPKERPPLAALQLPGRDAPVFVVEGDVIVIDGERDGQKESEPGAAVVAVHSITPRGIELAPKARPEDKVIIK